MQDLEQLAALHNAVMKMPDEEGLKFLSAAPGQFKHRFDGSIRSMLCGSIRTCSEQVRSMFSDEAEVEAMDDWSVNTVFTWLQGQHFLGDAKQTFATSAKRKEVDGSMLKLLKDPSMEKLGITSGVLRLKLKTHVIRVNALTPQIQKEDRALKAKTLAQQIEKTQQIEKEQHIEKLYETKQTSLWQRRVRSLSFIVATQSTQAMKSERAPET